MTTHVGHYLSLDLAPRSRSHLHESLQQLELSQKLETMTAYILKTEVADGLVGKENAVKCIELQSFKNESLAVSLCHSPRKFLKKDRRL